MDEPPLDEPSMSPAAKARVAAALLIGLMALAWFTLDAGRIRLVAVLLLGMFLVRVLLQAARSRYDEEKREEEEEA